MNGPPDIFGERRLRDQRQITPNAWLVLDGRGAKPKVWTSSMLRPVGLHDGWNWFALTRKGRGYRYQGRWVCELWVHEKNISIEAAFPSEEEAVEFMIEQAKRYMP